MSSFQVYQFISLNPLLIDDEELAIVNNRDDFNDKYKDKINNEESKSSFGEDSSMMSSNRRNHEFDGGIKRKSTLRQKKISKQLNLKERNKMGVRHSLLDANP